MSNRYDFILDDYDKYTLSSNRFIMYRPDSDTMDFFDIEIAADIIKELLAERAWHPYPAEKPEKDGEYLVTIGSTYIGSTYIKSQLQLVDYTAADEFGLFIIPVTAWCEAPEPYKNREPK